VSEKSYPFTSSDLNSNSTGQRQQLNSTLTAT